MAIRFSLTDLLDEQESYNFLLKTLHPDGLECKRGHAVFGILKVDHPAIFWQSKS